MRIADIRLLYSHSCWAVERILAAAGELTPEQLRLPGPSGGDGLRAVLVHILNWEITWRERCRCGLCESPWIAEEDYPDAHSLGQRWQVEAASMVAYLDALRDEDLTRAVRYRRRSGHMADAILWHLLMHILMHGAHHRSEAAALLTYHGASPGDLDLLVYLRQETSLAPDLVE
jgi:uncharacterized damage-inducible protein DinB